MYAPKVEATAPGRTICKAIGANACKKVKLGSISTKPAPMIISGEGIGTMTDSMITPANTLHGP